MNEEFYNAAVSGDIDDLRRLLAKEPSLVHSVDKWGFTALHGVAGEDQLATARFLLDQGADPNAKNDEGITPLHLAACSDMVELLIRRGAEIDVRSNDGRTPLLVQAAEAEGIDVMRTLLRLGADAKARDTRGNSAIDIARLREEEDKIELLDPREGERPRKWWMFWR